MALSNKATELEDAVISLSACFVYLGIYHTLISMYVCVCVCARMRVGQRASWRVRLVYIKNKLHKFKYIIVFNNNKYISDMFMTTNSVVF